MRSASGCDEMFVSSGSSFANKLIQTVTIQTPFHLADAWLHRAEPIQPSLRSAIQLQPQLFDFFVGNADASVAGSNNLIGKAGSLISNEQR